ncbi:MAG: hypothetical protein NVS9B15_03560 [Acidobacteriaceae bacterium]
MLSIALSSGQAPATFQQYVAWAQAAEQQDRTQEAVRFYGQALQMRPEWSEGWWKLGTLLYDGNDYVDAAEAFARLVELDDGNGAAHLFLGLCQYELKQDAPALQNLERAKELGIPNHPQLRKVMLYHEAMLELHKSAFESALATLRRLDKEGADTPEVRLAWGMAMLRIAGQAPSTDTETIARVGHAEQLAARKEFGDARKEIAEVVASSPSFPNMHYAFGHLLLEQHDTDAAIAEFQKEVARDPKHVFARLQIAAAHYRTDSALGLRYAQEAVRLDPALPFGHYLLGLLYLEVGDAAKAVPQLERARRTFAKEPKLYFALGTAYAKVGRLEEAKVAREEFTRLQSGEAQPELAIYGDQPR